MTYAGDISPTEAWKVLESDEASVLVDCRTPAEWTYVGVPDPSPTGRHLVQLPWQHPTGAINPDFVTQLEEIGLTPRHTLLFICRSGARSRAAAIAMTAAGYSNCYNVATGFEGDLNADQHRGQANGWKVEGLPWRQT